MDHWRGPGFARCLLALLISIHVSSLQASSDECVLDMKTPSSWNDSTLAEGNWGGFLNNNSCGFSFETYLYALAKRANKTGEIFPNITGQKSCLSSINCGIQRLTSGTGGCSDYTVSDVETSQEKAFQSLDQGCNKLGSNDESDEECRSCLHIWEQMTRPANITDDVIREEVDVCRFSVLVSLTSQRINELGWLSSIYTCLGSVIIPIADEARAEKKITFVKGFEVLAGGVGGVSVVAAVVWLILVKKRTKSKPSQGIDGIIFSCCSMTARGHSFSKESSSIKITLREVHLATDNLSPSNFIGQGIAALMISIRKVYKGILLNGQRVSVKHIVNDSHMETFVREVTSLSHIKHPNLVELLGHCDGTEESFLVYELCDNGNLSEWLFGKQKVLTWIQRLEIAIGCARGLWFLHTYPEGCIVHRDIKPTNILLGCNFEAKLSDFGLSKVICMEVSHVSSEVRGTFGYVDPEYQKNRHVHSSTGVYSFGVVLLQILSGQRVINLEVAKPMPLSKMAKSLRKEGDITEFADPKLDGEYSVEAFRVMFKLALMCTGLKQQRPSMERVVQVLEKAHLISRRVLDSLDS